MPDLSSGLGPNDAHNNDTTANAYAAPAEQLREEEQQSLLAGSDSDSAEETPTLEEQQNALEEEIDAFYLKGGEVSWTTYHDLGRAQAIELGRKANELYSSDEVSRKACFDSLRSVKQARIALLTKPQKLRKYLIDYIGSIPRRNDFDTKANKESLKQLKKSLKAHARARDFSDLEDDKKAAYRDFLKKDAAPLIEFNLLRFEAKALSSSKQLMSWHGRDRLKLIRKQLKQRILAFGGNTTEGFVSEPGYSAVSTVDDDIESIGKDVITSEGFGSGPRYSAFFTVADDVESDGENVDITSEDSSSGSDDSDEKYIEILTQEVANIDKYLDDQYKRDPFHKFFSKKMFGKANFSRPQTGAVLIAGLTVGPGISLVAGLSTFFLMPSLFSSLSSLVGGNVAMWGVILAATVVTSLLGSGLTAGVCQMKNVGVFHNKRFAEKRLNADESNDDAAIVTPSSDGSHPSA